MTIKYNCATKSPYEKGRLIGIHIRLKAIWIYERIIIELVLKSSYFNLRLPQNVVAFPADFTGVSCVPGIVNLRYISSATSFGPAQTQ